MEHTIIAAGPALVDLSDDQLDHVGGGRQTEITEQRNNGGNVPNGNANGVPEEVVAVENPQGKRPPGQQP
jgi:hypothetical protein